MSGDFDVNQLANWLNQRWGGNKNCPICGQNNWTIGKIVEVREFLKGLFGPDGVLYPIIPITCNNCAFTYFFNAVIAGIVKPPENKPPTSSEQSPLEARRIYRRSFS